jgi:hypothetical protein
MHRRLPRLSLALPVVAATPEKSLPPSVPLPTGQRHHKLCRSSAIREADHIQLRAANTIREADHCHGHHCSTAEPTHLAAQRPARAPRWPLATLAPTHAVTAGDLK